MDDDAEKVPTDEAQLLATCIAEKVKQLKELRHGNNVREKETQTAISLLLDSIRQITRKLIVQHPNYSVASQNDAHGKLWHNVYYKQIETYRKSILKHAAELKPESIPADKAQDPTADAELVKNKTYFVRLVNTYTKFLSDAIEFFQDMMLMLEDAVRDYDNLDRVTVSSYVKCIHKCLLSLGDLARYKESVAEGKDKNYDPAYRYYERAAFICPTSGTPQNQLAVLATYGQSELIAVYHYCRSVLVGNPFSLGYTNLATLFGKNEKAYVLAMRQADSEVAGNDSNFASRQQQQQSGGNKNDTKLRVQFFMLQFIRLHATIFEWCAASFDLLPNSKSTAVPVIDIEEFTSDVQDMLNNFHSVLSSLSDALLVRLLIICIYSVHESTPRGERDKERKDDNQDRQVKRNLGPRTIGESLSLVIIYGFINKIASNLLGEKKKNMKKILLAPFAIFAEWSSLFSEYLTSSTASLNGLGASNPALFSCAEVIRIEGRSRSGMRSVINLLDKSDFFEVKRSSAPISSTRGPLGAPQLHTKVLPEHLRLRGFLPLAERYEHYFTSPEPIPKVPALLSDDDARDLRLRILKAFVRDWLVPCAQREAVEGEERRQESAIKNDEPAQNGRGDEKKLWVPHSQKDSGNKKQAGGGEGGVKKRKEERAQKEKDAGKRVRSLKPTKMSSPVFALSEIYNPTAPTGDNPFQEEENDFQYELDPGAEGDANETNANQARHVAGYDDEMEGEIVVYQPTVSLAITDAGADRGILPSVSLQTMQSFSSNNSAMSDAERDEEDASMLLASATLGDWYNMSALGRIDPAADLPSWSASYGGHSSENGCAFRGGGIIDIGDKGWNASLGLNFPQFQSSNISMSAPPVPPPGFSTVPSQSKGQGRTSSGTPLPPPPGLMGPPQQQSGLHYTPYTSNPFFPHR